MDVTQGKQWCRQFVAAGGGREISSFRWRTISTVPRQFTAAWNAAFCTALDWVLEEPDEEAAWWLLNALPPLLLRMERRGGKASMQHRLPTNLSTFVRGDWETLWKKTLVDATADARTPRRPAPDNPDAGVTARLQQVRALGLAADGRYAAALGVYDNLGIAPPTTEGADSTLTRLRELHPDDNREIPAELIAKANEWAATFTITSEEVLKAASTSPRRRSEDSFGWKAEYVQASLGCQKTLDSLTRVFQRICRGQLPEAAAADFSGARLVPLNKPKPGIRPIGVPLVLRRIAGRIFGTRYRDSWADKLVGADGRVVQFAIGRKAGSQAAAFACQELLQLHPDWGATLMDADSAFQRASRAAIAEGIAECPEGGGREVLAFFLLLHNRHAKLTYLADGKPYIILGKAGCTQGCSLGMQFFALAIHPLLVKAAMAGPDVHIFSLADDITLIGPPEQRHAVAREILRLFAEQNLTIGKLGDLTGPDEPPSTLEALKATFHDVPNITIASMSDTGCVVGDTDAIPSGFRIVGGPIGTASFAKDFVRTIVDQHHQRLLHVKSLGCVNPQVGLLLLHYCCVNRMNFLQQLVPYSLASEHYDTAAADILSTHQAIIGYTDQQLNSGSIRTRLALPYTLGGQNITNPAITGDVATAGCWAQVASFLCATIPGLANLGAANGVDAPRWNTLPAVWTGLIARGNEVAAALPSIAQTLNAPFPHLQHKLLGAIHNTQLSDLLAKLTPPPPQHTYPEDASLAAHMRSQTGVGALSYHLMKPDFNHPLSKEQSIAAVLFELRLAQPGLLQRSATGAATAIGRNAIAVGDATLNQKQNTIYGGRGTTHNNVNNGVLGFGREAGGNTSNACGALIGPIPGATSDTVADGVITGLRGGAPNGILIDVVIKHVIGGGGVVKDQAHRITGDGAARCEIVKNLRYLPTTDVQNYDFYPLAMETGGNLGQAFHSLLRLLAGHAANNVETIRLNGRDTPKAYAGRLYTRWLGQLSMIRVRTIANRLRGASAEARAETAAIAAMLNAADIITPTD